MNKSMSFIVLALIGFISTGAGPALADGWLPSYLNRDNYALTPTWTHTTQGGNVYFMNTEEFGLAAYKGTDAILSLGWFERGKAFVTTVVDPVPYSYAPVSTTLTGGGGGGNASRRLEGSCDRTSISEGCYAFGGN